MHGMEQKIFHGSFQPEDLAACILLHFNRGNLEVHQIGSEDTIAVQIRTKQGSSSGGKTALGISFQKVEDGVAVQVGEQAWFGVAASLGFSALLALKNPLNLLGRIDDVFQDLEYIQLSDEVWKVLTANAKALGTGYALSERLHRIACEYCQTANPFGAPACTACGAPMGHVQPTTCPNCGFVLLSNENKCPNCRFIIQHRPYG